MKIAVLSGKGGVGKSMITSSLAILLSRQNKIIALDCDADTPNLALWLGITPDIKKGEKISTVSKPIIDKNKCQNCGLCSLKCPFNAIKKGPEILNYLCEGCGVCEYICPQNAITLKKRFNGFFTKEKTKYGFEVVSAHLIAGETGSGDIVNKIKEETSTHEITLIDAAAGIGCPVIASLSGVDLVIAVVEPSLSSISDLKRALELVKTFNIPFLVIINKWDLSKENTKKIENEYQDKVIGKISFDKEIFNQIANLKPIMESNLLAKTEIEKVFNNLNLYLKKKT